MLKEGKMSKKVWIITLCVILISVFVVSACIQPQQPATGISPSSGFNLHIDAKKHINDMPDQVVHHFCKSLNSDVSQCLLFDSDEPNARLIGVETIISPQLYTALPEAEKANWHYHKTEIPQVDAVLPGLSEKEVREVVAALENTYGKVIIFWKPNEPAPVGISITLPH